MPYSLFFWGGGGRFNIKPPVRNTSSSWPLLSGKLFILLSHHLPHLTLMYSYRMKALPPFSSHFIPWLLNTRSPLGAITAGQDPLISRGVPVSLGHNSSGLMPGPSSWPFQSWLPSGTTWTGEVESDSDVGARLAQGRKLTQLSGLATFLFWAGTKTAGKHGASVTTLKRNSTLWNQQHRNTVKSLGHRNSSNFSLLWSQLPATATLFCPSPPPKLVFGAVFLFTLP